MQLSELVRRAKVESAVLRGDASVTDLADDSRKVRLGSLFVCMPGLRTDPHTFLPNAHAAGATAALVHSAEGLEVAEKLGLAAVHILSADFAESLWRIADAFFDHPTRTMKLVGVTGTNGKTTTAWLLRDVFAALGYRSGYLGTLGAQFPDEERELSNTTPFTVEVYNLMAEMRDRGVQALAMEVSSHALAEKRADGLEFDAAVFTNLTQDHLDYHGTMEAYEAAKRRLFMELPAWSAKSFTAAINLEDPAGVRLDHLLEPSVPRVRYWRKDGTLAVGFESLRLGLSRIEGELVVKGKSAPFSAALGGAYNAENLASAVAGTLAVLPDTTVEQLAQALARVRPVPGRFEPVPNAAGIDVLVDYAHTPDALEKLLEAVRPLTRGRILTVFGCGGDRDRTKRPKMARAASEGSDLTVVTSDNPRTEDPQAILEEVRAGVVEGKASVAILDRREAIRHAVHAAQIGDTVVIAGKGHENYQIIGRTKFPMDDREMAREALEAR